MLHKTVEAKATATDQGTFTALAAAYSVDRMNERIIPGAFEKTIEAWQASGKAIPLHWDHSGDAKDIIGTVDPTSLTEVADGLQVSGQLDLKDSEVAREAWRLMKSNAVALSFGYLVEKADEVDGVLNLKQLDLFEISVTPAPANPDTRFLSLKSMKVDEIKALIERARAALDELEAKAQPPEDVKDQEDPDPDEATALEVQGAPEPSAPRAHDPVRDEIDLLKLGRS